jgi:hypothetical protein
MQQLLRDDFLAPGDHSAALALQWGRAGCAYIV